MELQDGKRFLAICKLERVFPLGKVLPRVFQGTILVSCSVAAQEGDLERRLVFDVFNLPEESISATPSVRF